MLHSHQKGEKQRKNISSHSKIIKKWGKSHC